MTPAVYRASLRAATDWKVGWLVASTVASLAIPDATWGLRLVGTVLALLIVTYTLMVIRLRVIIADDEVRVRRFRRGQAFRKGDDVGVETIGVGRGSPLQNIVLRRTGARPCRLPMRLFSRDDGRKLADHLESVLG